MSVFLCLLTSPRWRFARSENALVFGTNHVDNTTNLMLSPSFDWWLGTRAEDTPTNFTGRPHESLLLLFFLFIVSERHETFDIKGETCVSTQVISIIDEPTPFHLKHRIFKRNDFMQATYWCTDDQLARVLCVNSVQLLHLQLERWPPAC